MSRAVHGLRAAGNRLFTLERCMACERTGGHKFEFKFHVCSRCGLTQEYIRDIGVALGRAADEMRRFGRAISGVNDVASTAGSAFAAALNDPSAER